jgi:hypothetical protein
VLEHHLLLFVVMVVVLLQQLLLLVVVVVPHGWIATILPQLPVTILEFDDLGPT